MNTPTYAVHGTWRPASPPADVDLEAQPITGTYALLAPPAVPAPAQTRTPHVFTTDAIGDLFGARPSRIRISATCTSRHDAPPPYADVEVLPAYSAAPNMGSNKEPDTLAMYLFAFGFRASWFVLPCSRAFTFTRAASFAVQCSPRFGCWARSPS